MQEGGYWPACVSTCGAGSSVSPGLIEFIPEERNNAGREQAIMFPCAQRPPLCASARRSVREFCESVRCAAVWSAGDERFSKFRAKMDAEMEIAP
jgi:hypothetical protein